AYAPDYITTLMPHLQAVGEIRELLAWDAAWRAHALDSDGALESCRALLNACRSVGDEPFLVSQLVRYAGNSMLAAALERVLAQGEPSEAALKDMQQALAAEIATPRLWIAV